ncbi:L-serine dehydratase [Friedmanniella endophytica]|uniref:L-serine dehydratase n=1 Tax=Microlunatus kandeliicorticis TaxID=1759536 RepID=A0A7W3ITA7_9ACTN|nr:L-serine ammonia-lyase [Microlunatus kandeliicorticis]MBA8794825.1 L-serine dehydratase [Microlunatus kandeliicorticis]
MSVSVFDLFSIGIGPSSSHTVGPMRAAGRFAAELGTRGLLDRVVRVRAELFGSLGATGHGHGSEDAVLLGLEGEDCETVDTDLGPVRAQLVRDTGRLRLAGRHELGFDVDTDLVLHRRRALPGHPNGMVFATWLDDDDPAGEPSVARTYYSVGGGFVLGDDGTGRPALAPDPTVVPFPFRSSAELLAHCDREGRSISAIMMANETARRPEREVRSGLLRIWQVMVDCVHHGCTTPGTLPGGLKVRRRAAELNRSLLAERSRFAHLTDPLAAMDWVTLWALAVNEENASGGRVVTAPTNGAAGIIPAVLHYAVNLVPGTGEDEIVEFLLTAGAIGAVYQQTGSISGAQVGCQGEVGTACSMAAAALAEVLGGTPRQVENAAEIGMEHHLGLTCDPVGGLVQIPCIERNAIGSVKAITAARLALRGDGEHTVSLDQVIKTMMETGADMKIKYKETSRGGLAVNIVEC